MPEKEDSLFENESSDRTQQALQMSEISLILDTYDDIFSDFDPRNYSQRSISVDLLEEAERASRDKHSGDVELNFLVPKEQRNFKKENVIRKRLKDHFRKHFLLLREDKKKITRKGLLFVFFGIIFMFFATYLMYNNLEISFLISFLIVILEPAGWFLFWEGLNQMLYETKSINPKLNFYEKMHTCNINFFDY